MVFTYCLYVVPNVVTNDCRISFSIPQSGKINLKLFDVSGRLVNILCNQYLESGRHEMDFDFSELRNGIYIVLLESTLGNQKTKLIKIR